MSKERELLGQLVLAQIAALTDGAELGYGIEEIAYEARAILAQPEQAPIEYVRADGTPETRITHHPNGGIGVGTPALASAHVSNQPKKVRQLDVTFEEKK